ncbi:MAG: efflux transporter outer membrane subunit [Nevskia sp.]|nr:efflux transporter outer membrane subunit [Nevskia sp.]
MRRTRARQVRIAHAVLAAAALACGCAVGPDFKRPAAPAVDRYTAAAQPAATAAADGQVQRFTAGGAVAAQWWRQFGSPQLDAAVEQAFAGNPGLQAAQASLRQSQDQLRAGYGIFYPQAEAAAAAARQRSTPQRSGLAVAPTIYSLFTLSASVSYALDVFGGERRTVEGLAAQAELQGYEVQASYLALAANTVNTAIARAAYAAELQSTQAQIAAVREQVRLAQVRADAGTAPYSDVLALQGQLAAYEAALAPLRQKLDQSEDLLATLAGRAPAQQQAPDLPLADLRLPADIPLAVPSSLVRQRPDILAAEAALHAASAGVGVATAALFPSVTLDAAYGAASTSAGNLFSSGNRYWSAGAGIAAPVFEGGTLWYQRRAAQERYRQAEAGYRQTVLAAFAQVADSLHALEHDAEALDAQSRQLRSAAQALHLVQAGYQAGLADSSQVLLADSQYQQAQIGYLQSKALRLQDTVALYAALGGGWNPPQPQASRSAAP